MPSSATVELWTLYGFAASFTVLRTYARVSAVGIWNLQADDYLVWVAMLIYTAQCILGYSVGMIAHGMANNEMTPSERNALPRDSPEYRMRVIGSKIQVAGWTTAACLLWSLKLCVAFFYLRLIGGLHKYQKRIYIGLAFITTTFIVVILTIYLSCRPFYRYWQINPDPGNSCQAAVSKTIIWVTYPLNVSTDLYLLMIPIPMLWTSGLKPYKKTAATMVLGAGGLVVICATLKNIYLCTDPVHSGELAASWGMRETFVAIVTTNVPMIFPLLKTLLASYLPSTLASSNTKAQTPPDSGFVSIGGGGGALARARTARHSMRHLSTNMTFDNESEENMVRGNQVKLQYLQGASPQRQEKHSIVVSKQFSITTEDCEGHGNRGSYHAA
ncbi:hypothetical protein TW65_08986 [Stemphylium lycopersici]|uniref:Triacylglycerol lipase-like protein n=1 Tax=Stemphylium lycopersici TaxID=183478 RepID=A0A364MUL0_STELY|nr:hypothetical protein TW65_08986 [Stemphylium lycopersici]RAR04155.1 triacylglycerol lipase-like protein [Stemphylium lycopersici]